MPREAMTYNPTTTAPDDWYRLVVDAAPGGLVVFDEGGVIRLVNRAAERLFGFDRAELVGRSIARLLPEGVDGLSADRRERYARRKDGAEVPVEVAFGPIETPQGRFTLASFTELTEGRRAAEASRRQRTMLDALPSMVGYWDAGLINRFANAAYQSWFGVEGPSLEGRHMRELLGAELFERNRPYAEAALRGEAQTFERAIPRPGSSEVRHSLAHYLPDVVAGEVRGFHVLVHDVSEMVENRRSLTASLKEREVLLKEVHHRVKNNLQVITSLLSMQVRRLGAGEARDSIEECRQRVMVIALVHQHLYAARDYADIDFGRYIRSLVSSAFRLGAASTGVVLRLDIEDVVLGVGAAIPCALLINELVTNALKHAFVGRDAGVVAVGLARDGDRLRVEVIDDGVGLPEGFAFATAGSVGSQLVLTLAAQLHGRLELGGAPGTTVRLEFPVG